MSESTSSVRRACFSIFGRESLLAATSQTFSPTQDPKHWRDHQCTKLGKQVFTTEFAEEIACTPNYLDRETTQEGKTAQQLARFESVLRTLRETETKCLSGRDSEVQECPFEAAMKRFRLNSYMYCPLKSRDPLSMERAQVLEHCLGASHEHEIRQADLALVDELDTQAEASSKSQSERRE